MAGKSAASKYRNALFTVSNPKPECSRSKSVKSQPADFKKAIDQTIAATRKHNKALGRLVPTVEQGIDIHGQGFDFICYSGDVWVLHNALAEAVTKLRDACGKK